MPFRRIYSFRDVVSLRTLAMLRKQRGVRLDDLRRTGPFLRDTAADRADPWAEFRFGVLGNRVVFRDPATGNWLTATPPGQTVLPIDVEEVARTAEREAARFSERDAGDYGRVVRHRHVLGNAWRIAGTRIPTSAIWHFHEDGSDVDAIKRACPDLTEQDIVAATEHEQRLRAERAA